VHAKEEGSRGLAIAFFNLEWTVVRFIVHSSERYIGIPHAMGSRRIESPEKMWA
jgi:hypothetical protein